MATKSSVSVLGSNSSLLGLALVFSLCLGSSLRAASVVRGTLEVVDSAGKVTVLSVGQEIPAGTSIKVKVKGGAVISATPGVEVTLGQDASVTLSAGADGQMTLNVLAGSVSYTAATGFTGAFTIQTPAGAVSVQSGAGSLIATGTSVRVSTSSGKATFTGAGRVAVEIPSGSVLGVSGTAMTMVNLTTKMVSVIGLDKSVVSTQPATTSDLQLAQVVAAAAAPKETQPQPQPSAAAPNAETTLTAAPPNPANTSGKVVSPAQ